METEEDPPHAPLILAGSSETKPQSATYILPPGIFQYRVLTGRIPMSRWLRLREAAKNPLWRRVVSLGEPKDPGKYDLWQRPNRVFSSLGREIYVRSMLPTRNGLPMWMPETYDDGPDCGASGVIIGDVGLLTSECLFNVLFNLCLPTDHILNTDFRPPDGFEPLHLDDSDVEVTPLHFKEGALITSAGVDVHLREDDLHGNPKFEVVSHEPEGAALLLQAGATRHEVVNLAKFRSFVSKHALFLHDYAIRKCGQEFDSGQLMVVTGCDKATAFASTVFSNGTNDYATTLVMPGEEPALPITADHAEIYATTLTSSRHRSFPSETANQAVFLRGFKICFRQELWDSRYENVRPRPFLSCLFPRRREYLLERELRKIEDGDGPMRRRPFDPSEAIGRILVEKTPSVDISIVHVNDWHPIMKDGNDAVYTREELWKRLMQAYTVVVEDGVVFLQKKNSTETHQRSAKAKTPPSGPKKALKRITGFLVPSQVTPGVE